ncbi:MAG: hypothetical protein IPL52_12030 [Flavobacteriales bacterium]|nr:hypothetical protein [Flavobacteriales bacterium]
MRDQQWAWFVGCSVLLMGACRKDKDDTAPTVHILYPAAGSTVNVPDTITIGVHVEDNEGVEQLTVMLTDSEGLPVGPIALLDIHSASAQVQVELAITSERLESGNYQVIARASDGENDGRAFLDLWLLGAPLRLRSIFLVPPAASSPPYTITRIDSTGALSTWATTSELGGTAIDLDHIYLAGESTQPLVRRRISNGSSTTLLANEGVPGAPLPFFHGLDANGHDSRTYVGTVTGALRGFNAQGNGVFNATSPIGTYSELSAVIGNYVVSIARNAVLGTRQTINYAHNSGATLGQFPFDLTPVALHTSGGDHLLAFGNRNGDGVIQERNVEAGGVYEMQVLSGTEIGSVARVDEYTFAVATESGVLRFERPGNSIQLLAPLPGAGAIVFDKTSGSLLVGVGDQLIRIDPSTGVQLDVLTAPTAIGGILLQSNR